METILSITRKYIYHKKRETGLHPTDWGNLASAFGLGPQLAQKQSYRGNMKRLR